MSEAVTVNCHYLNRLVAVADSHGVEAMEDIVSGQGVKLVSKGSSIDARVRDRLLQHKLLKPLEGMVRVIGGAATRPIDAVADGLLRRHALLSGLCTDQVAHRVERAFLDLRLAPPVESLLSLFAEQGPRHLEHAVGVSLLAAALLEQMHVAEISLPTMLVAGLMHDVGDLYIDPAILNNHQKLSASEWKHVATHPIVGASLLRELQGAGPVVAELVLLHHERLDGFGYPRGLRQGRIPLGGQVLALSEMLMGVIESGSSPGEHAAVAVKLIPGEFNRQLMNHVIRSAKAASMSDAVDTAIAPVSNTEIEERANRCVRRLEYFNRVLDGVDSESEGLHLLTGQVSERVRCLERALASVGLQWNGGVESHEFLCSSDPHVAREIHLVLQEFCWRLDELSRELWLRCDALAPRDASQMRRAMALADQAPASTALDLQAVSLAG